MRRRSHWILGVAAGVALFLTGCGTVKIGRVLSDPYHYHNRNVRVEGNVTHSFGAFTAGGYQIDDGTGKIIVISNRGVPSKGARVKVSGTVTSGVTVMGRSFGTAIRESNHKLTGYVPPR
jgi:hypothetical protein